MPRLAAAWRGLAAAAVALLTAAVPLTVTAVPSSAAAGTATRASTRTTTAAVLPSGRDRAGGRSPRAPEEFVALREVDPTIVEEIRYATPHDFLGVPVTGYREPIC